jgi:predicted flap endonuclease-1-like 5' DNA nuclease
MNTLLILLLQTKGEATVILVSLQLVAAIIGYVTAWLYNKSVYEEKLKAVESEKHELNNRIVNLDGIIVELKKGLTEKDLQAVESDKHELNNRIVNLDGIIVDLQKCISEKDLETDHLLLEVKALKALHKEAVQETDEMTLKNKRNEQLLYEKDEALVNIVQRKHLLDYDSFGIATSEEKDDLKMISGIGPFIEERLHALDIFTFRQISKFTVTDINTINDAIEYFSGRIERDEWVAQAKEILHNKDQHDEMFKRISERKPKIYYNRIGFARKEEADDLTIISGIGGWIMEKLNALDIYTFQQISNFDKDDIITVTDAIEFFPGRIERDEWILQAKDLIRIEGKKSELLKRIRDRQGRIYYDRLGIAHKHEANNLTLIDGLGSWVEERLNMLGIYTFEQVSRLTKTDIDTITEVLEIIPGRIEQDDWVGQSRMLTKKLHLAV